MAKHIPGGPGVSLIGIGSPQYNGRFPDGNNGLITTRGLVIGNAATSDPAKVSMATDMSGWPDSQHVHLTEVPPSNQQTGLYVFQLDPTAHCALGFVGGVEAPDDPNDTDALCKVWLLDQTPAGARDEVDLTGSLAFLLNVKIGDTQVPAASGMQRGVGTEDVWKWADTITVNGNDYTIAPQARPFGQSPDGIGRILFDHGSARYLVAAVTQDDSSVTPAHAIVPVLWQR